MSKINIFSDSPSNEDIVELFTQLIKIRQEMDEDENNEEIHNTISEFLVEPSELIKAYNNLVKEGIAYREKLSKIETLKSARLTKIDDYNSIVESIKKNPKKCSALINQTSGGILKTLNTKDFSGLDFEEKIKKLTKIQKQISDINEVYTTPEIEKYYNNYKKAINEYKKILRSSIGNKSDKTDSKESYMDKATSVKRYIEKLNKYLEILNKINKHKCSDNISVCNLISIPYDQVEASIKIKKEASIKRASLTKDTGAKLLNIQAELIRAKDEKNKIMEELKDVKEALLRANRKNQLGVTTMGAINKSRLGSILKSHPTYRSELERAALSTQTYAPMTPYNTESQIQANLQMQIPRNDQQNTIQSRTSSGPISVETLVKGRQMTGEKSQELQELKTHGYKLELPIFSAIGNILGDTSIEEGFKKNPDIQMNAHDKVLLFDYITIDKNVIGKSNTYNKSKGPRMYNDLINRFIEAWEKFPEQQRSNLTTKINTILNDAGKSSKGKLEELKKLLTPSNTPVGTPDETIPVFNSLLKILVVRDMRPGFIDNDLLSLVCGIAVSYKDEIKNIVDPKPVALAALAQAQVNTVIDPIKDITDPMITSLNTFLDGIKSIVVAAKLKSDSLEKLADDIFGSPAYKNFNAINSHGFVKFYPLKNKNGLKSAYSGYNSKPITKEYIFKTSFVSTKGFSPQVTDTSLLNHINSKIGDFRTT